MSLKSMIVDTYSALLEILLWLIVIAGGITGYYVEHEVMSIDGWFVGAGLGALAGFILDVVFFGGIALLLDTRDTLKEIRDLAAKKALP